MRTKREPAAVSGEDAEILMTPVALAIGDVAKDRSLD
jgi:hypothetical protein